MPPLLPNNSLFSDLPSKPGVYLMKNSAGQVLYIGKAKNLKKRVSQYFLPGRDGRPTIPYLTRQVTDIKTIVVSSEKEALLLENTLIKEHQPKYNVLLKDDKTFFSLMINHKHPWPMPKIVRMKGKPPSSHLYFGPYTESLSAKRILELLRTLFPLRQCSDLELVSRSRPCILYDLGKCIAPCVGKCSKAEYSSLVEKMIAFLKGKDKSPLQTLKKEMKKASDNLEFERAHHIYKTLQAASHVLEEQRVEKIGGEDFDVLDFARKGEIVALALLAYREGKLTSCTLHLCEKCVQEDEELVSSFLLQHYALDELFPPQILLPFRLQHHALIEGILQRKLLVPQKGKKRDLLQIAKENAKEKLSHFAESNLEKLLAELEEKLGLTHFPERIECFDHSHLSGREGVCSRVVFIDGRPNYREYRKYKVSAEDDYGAISEALKRRFSKKDLFPDLLIIDGGRGHLTAALKVLKELNISTIDVIGLAKERGRHDKGLSREQIFLSGEKEPLLLPEKSPLLFMLQNIRDEAHRFAISFHKNRRKKKLLHSLLDEIPGIGPVKKKRLLLHFGSVERVLQASASDLRNISGITEKDIQSLLAKKEC